MRVAVFVDGNNYRYMVRDHLGWGFDFNKFIEFCGKFGDIVDATYYISEDPRDEGFQKFSHAIATTGMSVVNKPPKFQHQPVDATRDTATPFRPSILKANMDVEIAVGIMTSLDIFDMAVLVSGDGDFKCVIDLLRSRGKQFKVVSCRPMIAEELFLVAGMHYLDAQMLRRELEHGYAGKQTNSTSIDYASIDDIEVAYPILGSTDVQDVG